MSISFKIWFLIIPNFISLNPSFRQRLCYFQTLNFARSLLQFQSYCFLQAVDLELLCFNLIFFTITPETIQVGSFFDAGICVVIDVDYSVRLLIHLQASNTPATGFKFLEREVFYWWTLSLAEITWRRLVDKWNVSMELGIQAKICSTAKLLWTSSTEILICVESQWEGQTVRVGNFCTIRHHNILCYNLSRLLTTKMNLNKRQKGKGIALQAWTGPEGSRCLKRQDFKTFGTWSW